MSPPPSPKALTQSSLTKEMVLTTPKAAFLSDCINIADNKRNRVLATIEAIKDHKRAQKKLYREYYLAADDLKDTIESHANDTLIYNAVKHFKRVDTSDIFYKASKMK